MKKASIPELYFATAEEWRAWLQTHHDRESAVWLVFFKKESGRASPGYDEAVEEALCFGWIDSIIRKIDDLRFARKFTPRKEDSKWSPSNKRRVERLIRSGRMTEVGLSKIKAARESGRWDQPDRPEINYELPPAFQKALEENLSARNFFDRLAPGYQKQFIAWIRVAKRPETVQKRIDESIDLLNRGEKLGMK